MADLIKIAEEAFATGKQFPKFKAGDTITVAYKIVEGNKERIQLYRGVVNVFSPSNHRTSKASRWTRLVRYVALSFTTSVPSLVRRLVLRKSVLLSTTTNLSFNCCVSNSTSSQKAIFSKKDSEIKRSFLSRRENSFFYRSVMNRVGKFGFINCNLSISF